MNYNKATIVGRLAHTPEIKTFDNGTKVVNMSVATNYSYKDNQGNKVESTDWHNVVAFGKVAETLAQYCEGGQEMLFEGRMRVSQYQKDGEEKKRTKVEIIVENFAFGARSQARADRKASDDQPQAQGKPKTTNSEQYDVIEYPDEDINPNDIPF